MKFSLLLLALLIPSVHAVANTIINLDSDATVQVGTSIDVTIANTSAQRLFDALTVAATPGWEDTMTTNKSVAGIYCFNEASAQRYAQCEIQVNPDQGVRDALSQGPNDVVLAFDGAAAAAIYNALNVPAVSENVEDYDFSKTVPGFTCQNHKRVGLYDCVVWVDAARGIVR